MTDLEAACNAPDGETHVSPDVWFSAERLVATRTTPTPRPAPMMNATVAPSAARPAAWSRTTRRPSSRQASHSLRRPPRASRSPGSRNRCPHRHRRGRSHRRRDRSRAAASVPSSCDRRAPCPAIETLAPLELLPASG